MEATTTEARSMGDEVQSRFAGLVASADASASRATEEIARHVKQVVVAAYSDVQVLRIVAEVTQ